MRYSQVCFLFLGTTALTQADLALAMPKYTDDQIAKIILTINEGEVAASELAVKRAQNKEVKSFAQEMVKVHKNNFKTAQDVAKKNDIDPAETEISKSFKSEADTSNKNLKDSKGTDFDKVYIDQQIAMHEKALDMIEKTLIPNATFLDLRNHLEQTKSTVEKHLAHAKNIRGRL